MKGCVVLSKKKLLSFVLCFAIIFTCLLVNEDLPTAISGTSGVYESKEPICPPESDFTYEVLYESEEEGEEEGIIITGYSGNETKVIIPETLDGLTVVEVSPEVFFKNERLTYIKLPSGLSFISGEAFQYCSSLTEIQVNENNPYFVSIDGVLYMKDTNENSATFGKPIYLSNFPAGKSGSYTIPYGVKTIGSYAFSRCYNLTEIKMHNTVTIINAYAFENCWGLENIRLSDNLKILRKKALANCFSLKYIDLPSSLINIGDDAFLGDIDSDDNKVYFFTDGIACVKDSYSYKYLRNQHLPEDIIIKKDPNLTDVNTGISIIDPYRKLPSDGLLDIVVTPVDITEVESLFPTRYSKAYAFEISLTLDGEAYIPNEDIIINFDAACPGALPSATKVYQQIGDELITVSGVAHIPFVGAQGTIPGRFIILVNDDFSLKGDIDGDGVVTLFDVKASLYASTNILTLTPEQKLAANVDNSQDGKITTKDARKILRLAGGMNAE